ncbi:MAG TPA: Shedu immune nuclease family protein [Thermoanaerobaculia bacterium]|jgi:hypothetical protein
MEPSAIYLEPSALIARKVAPLIKSADFRVYDARDTSEVDGIHARLHAEGLGAQLHLFVVSVDRPPSRPNGAAYDVAAVEQLRTERANETVDGVRRFAAIPLIALTDDPAAATEAIKNIDETIPILPRTPDSTQLLSAIQRVLSEYRHELMRGLQRMGNAIVRQDGRFRLVGAYGGALSSKIIKSRHVHGLPSEVEEAFNRLVIVTERWRSSELVLAEFEQLINSSPPERELHRFFERNPHFLMASGYDAGWSEPVLHRSGSSSYIRPDFVLGRSLREQQLDESKIVEFKRADVLVLDRTTHRSSPSHAAVLSHAVTRVMTQLEDYGDYFADPRNADVLRKRFGGVIPQPRRVAIIGRRPAGLVERFDTLRQRRYNSVEVLTYDDVLDFHRTRFEALRAGSDDFTVPMIKVGETQPDGVRRVGWAHSLA